MSYDKQAKEENGWQKPVHWAQVIVIYWWPAIICNDYKNTDETISEGVKVPVWDMAFHVTKTIIVVVLNRFAFVIETKLSRKELESKDSETKGNDQN